MTNIRYMYIYCWVFSTLYYRVYRHSCGIPSLPTLLRIRDTCRVSFIYYRVSRCRLWVLLRDHDLSFRCKVRNEFFWQSKKSNSSVSINVIEYLAYQVDFWKQKCSSLSCKFWTEQKKSAANERNWNEGLGEFLDPIKVPEYGIQRGEIVIRILVSLLRL